MKKRFLTLGFLLLTLLAVGSAWAGAPTDRLKAGIDKVIVVLGDPKYKAPGADKEEMKVRVRAATKEFFDFRELSMRAVGKPWLQFTPQEQDRFIGLFTNILEDTYLQKVQDYSGEKVVYGAEVMAKDNYAQVATTVQSKSGDIPVAYSMKKDSDWMVYDVTVEGVSLVKNYRTQFGEILDTSSDAAFAKTKTELFSRMEQKLAELKDQRNKQVSDKK